MIFGLGTALSLAARFKWPLIAGAIVVGLGLAAWHINDAAYNRGRDETVARMERVIEKQRAAVKADVERLRNLTPTELDRALWRKCKEAGGTEAICGKEP